MCGICGIAAGDRSHPVDEAALIRMNDSIAYRGPDESGTYVGPGIGLAARRLSIIDVADGHQPLHNEDGTIHVAFNGEIYNYRELRSLLLGRGHEFRTNCDTEVVVHAYEEWGEACLERFRGMFAVALWDARRERLLLAVDRFGIKPLYVGLLDGNVVFGSELRCLLASDRLSKRIDHAALAEYFTLGYIPAPGTIFTGVSKLEPGTLATWERSTGELRTDRYWDVPPDGEAARPTPRDAAEEIRALLADSVRAHMISDVPLGAFLSGGIDSSTVVALMSEASDAPVRTFSIGFESREHDERPLARLVAERFRTDHHEFVLEPESVDVLPKLVRHFQEPFADSSALPTYYISKLAREFVKVALSGDGGDELFVGYPTFRGVDLARRVQTLPRVARRTLAAFPARAPRFAGTGVGDRVARWHKWATDTALPPEAAYRSKITMTGRATVWPLLAPDLRAELEAQDPFRTIDRALESARDGDGIAPFLYAGLRVALPGDMLVKVDRMSMANSLEVRVPLLDHVLAEYVARIPAAQRFPRWQLKALLKEAMKGTLPREVLEQRKHGFTIPLARWFRGDLVGFAGEILTGPETRARGLLDVDAVTTFLRQHSEGRRNLGPAIWSLLIFELWCREILD